MADLETFLMSVFLLFLVVLFRPMNVSAAISSGDPNSTTPLPTASMQELVMPTTQEPVTPTTQEPVTPTTPSQDPKPSNWQVTDNTTGFVCVVMRVAIRMTFNYNISGALKTDQITDVPADALTSGYCGAATQQLSLVFYDQWNLTFTFTNNATTNQYSMEQVSLSYRLEPGQYPFPDASALYANTDLSSKDYFDVADGSSYVCTSRQTAVVGSGSVTTGPGLVNLDLLDLQVEAFRGNVTTGNFAEQGGRCRDDEVSNLIPIIVGAALGGLILIVIIAYFIGLSRSKTNYTSI